MYFFLIVMLLLVISKSFALLHLNAFNCFNCCEVDFFCVCVCICRTQHSNFNSEGFWKLEGEWKVVDAGRELPFLLAERDKIRHKVLMSVLFARLFLLILFYVKSAYVKL